MSRNSSPSQHTAVLDEEAAPAILGKKAIVEPSETPLFDEKTGRDTRFLVGWDGPEDPENPQVRVAVLYEFINTLMLRRTGVEPTDGI